MRDVEFNWGIIFGVIVVALAVWVGLLASKTQEETYKGHVYIIGFRGDYTHAAHCPCYEPK